LAFDNNFIYAGLQAGGKCWGSSGKIGKHGSSNDCNYPCPDGKDTCGGKHSNTIIKLSYQKDFLCSIEQKFDELKSNGDINYGNGGVLTNPSDDGERFTWTPRVEGEPFNMTAIRSKSGTVKGFKTFSDNPYYNDGLKFITWYEADGEKEMDANGVKYFGVDSYSIEGDNKIEVRVAYEGKKKENGYTDDNGYGYFDGYAYYNSFYDYKYTDAYEYDTGSVFYE